MLGWTIDPTTNVAIIPPNPDNQIEATVVQEAIKLPRKSTLMLSLKGLLKISFRTDKNHRTLQKLALYTVVSQVIAKRVDRRPYQSLVYSSMRKQLWSPIQP